ncbi:hypothetical protein SWSSV_gp003 [White spot syndrome virus]|uniref:Wsv004 n=4 Tax=White spot syndrome virus TaxID=342409 RepID=Q8VBF4_WSSVS|nr:wsv004 [Shrimp white spot syndrome virus]YP_009220477.1 hypothetical protein SWSSV_gp003 [White spot syndrome virus]AYW76490.1 hypothetical protein [Procambarus clarkii virus]AAL33008.1 wsv004 [Shrimp white spot syndrome virus]AAL88928.1 WSSV060 [Shrimp white spot syndrome virus]AFX59381.1 wsv004 [White spot syndrome virus]ALL15510.1 ORF32 [White spot syndrome virus]
MYLSHIRQTPLVEERRALTFKMYHHNNNNQHSFVNCQCRRTSSSINCSSCSRETFNSVKAIQYFNKTSRNNTAHHFKMPASKDRNYSSFEYAETAVAAHNISQW